MSRAVSVIGGLRRSTSHGRADRPRRAPPVRRPSTTIPFRAGSAAASARRANRWPTRCPARSRSGVPPGAPRWRSCSSSASLRQATRRRSSGTALASTPPVAARRCSICLSDISRTLISPVIFPSTQRSGVTSPATTAEPSPHAPSMVTTELSPVSGLRVNMTPAAARIHHRLHDHGHGDVALGNAAMPPIADRLHRVQAGPAGAHAVEHLRAVANPEKSVLQSGEAGVAGVLGGGRGAHGDVRLCRPGTQGVVGGREFADQRVRQRGLADALAQRRSRRRRWPRDRPACSAADARAHRVFALEIGEELLEGPRPDHETGRHGDAGARELSQAAALAAHLGAVAQTDLLEPADDCARAHGLRCRVVC